MIKKNWLGTLKVEKIFLIIMLMMLMMMMKKMFPFIHYLIKSN